MCSSCHLGIRNLAVERLGRWGRGLAGQCYFVQYSHKLLWEIRSMAGCPFSPQNAEAEKVAAQCHCLQCSDECLCKGFLGWSCWVGSNVEEVDVLFHGVFHLWWCGFHMFRGEEWQHSLWLLGTLQDETLQPTLVTYNASISILTSLCHCRGHCRCGIYGTLDSRSQKKNQHWSLLPEIIWGACAKGSQWQLALLWLTELGESADIITFNSVLAAFDSSGQHLGCVFSVDDHQHVIEWHFKSWRNRRNRLFMAAYGLCKEFSVGWPCFSLALLLADLGGKEPLIW